MELTLPESLLAHKRTLVAVVLLGVALFALSNLPWQLDDYDQAKQAFTSYEMLKEGHWFYQRTPHERIATKPPLVGWISAGVFTISRSWDVAWRLPSFLSAAAIAALLFRVATKFYGAAAGLLALGAFMMNLLTPRLATLVRTDMPLALVIFLIGLTIWNKVRAGEVWNRRDRLTIFALLTAGVLIKGPIVYAFLLPGLAFFQWRRDRAGASAWPGWWPWFGSLLIFLAWVIGGAILVPQFYDQVVMREFVARFGETVHEPRPIYFYIVHVLHKFAPWSLLMIAAAVVRWRSQTRDGSIFRHISAPTFWLICWIFGGLIVMSIVPSKRVDRIFPVIPPLCLLLAAQIGELSSQQSWRRRIYGWCVVVLIAGIVFAGSYSVWKVARGYQDHRDTLAVLGRNVREQAAAHQLRYDAMTAGDDEGLLLYLEKTRFISPESAVEKWNQNEIDALIVSKKRVDELLPQLGDATVSPMQSVPKKLGDKVLTFVVITRAKR